MSIAKRLIDNSLIPDSQKDQFLKEVNQLSDELGISRDYLPIIFATETGVPIDPHAYSGNHCGGLIQICAGQGGDDNIGLSARRFSQLSAIEQIPYIKKYFRATEEWNGSVKGSDLATTYLYILTPGEAHKDRDVPLKIPPQSAHLYDANGNITKASLEKGLLEKAQISPDQLNNNAIFGNTIDSAISIAHSDIAQYSVSVVSHRKQRINQTMAQNKVIGPDKLSISDIVQSGTAMASNVNGPAMGKPNKLGLNKTAGANGFMDPMGISSEKVFFMSPYGPRWGKLHAGIDLAAGGGNPIVASKAGIVEVPPFDTGGYGNWVMINHQDGYETIYGHLKEIHVKTGQQVSAGTVLGLEGTTGGSTGPHLHFEIIFNNQPMDPACYIPEYMEHCCSNSCTGLEPKP